MSEDANFEDAPAQVRLSRVIAQRAMELGTVIAERKQAKTGVEEIKNYAGIAANSPLFPVSIGEIDAIQVELLHTEPEKKVSIIGLKLFSDKSPFVYEADIDLPKVDNSYDLVCLPEHPPFFIHDIRVHETVDPDSVRAYLREVQEGKQPAPPILDEAQAEQIINIINDPVLSDHLDLDTDLNELNKY
ncbi:MAG TPA: hypothetical protein VLE69_02030 [Candidatus Saccharimonadales bacterium]|nr:hypothetical protein [Candidatus Saccharimonadales bacterium]